MRFYLFCFDAEEMSELDVAQKLAAVFGGEPTLIEIRTDLPIVEVPAPPPTVVPEPLRHNFGMRSHQEVINIFSRLFGPSYWEVITRAGLGHIGQNRGATWLGPDIESLPLSESERAALIRAL